MNMRSFMVLGAISAMTLGACVVVGPTGGSGTAGEGGGGVGGGSGGGDIGSGGSGGGGMCDTSIGCADAITIAGTDPNDLCEESGEIYDAYQLCVCTTSCAAPCGADRCGKSSGDEATCDKCIQDSCSTQAMDCSNDAGG